MFFIKRVVRWCRTIVGQGVHWIEQQILTHTKPSVVSVVIGAAADSIRSEKNSFGKTHCCASSWSFCGVA